MNHCTDIVKFKEWSKKFEIWNEEDGYSRKSLLQELCNTIAHMKQYEKNMEIVWK